ncbi:MAG: helix-turn-helix domain-containing protein [Desulfovibrio sp.]|nr:helix-turn-helix domain-containing protein [Desulfovibrio sp.]MCA1985865.1 helix-turn-helix domain-containing protein [Desulfovibrio sp.]
MARLVLAGLETMAQELGCSKKTLYRWIRERGFPAFKMDGAWRALPREVETWLMEQRALQEGRGDGPGATGG